MKPGTPKKKKKKKETPPKKRERAAAPPERRRTLHGRSGWKIDEKLTCCSSPVLLLLDVGVLSISGLLAV
jgi:hypothetical protein